jgi:hypothetical protein
MRTALQTLDTNLSYFNFSAGSASLNKALFVTDNTDADGESVRFTGRPLNGTDTRSYFTFLRNGADSWWGIAIDSGNNFAIHNSGNRDFINFQQSTGNVGIGTSTPGAKLEVNGDFIRTIPRWQGTGADGTDNGVLSGRSFSFTKHYAATGIKASWSDTFRVLGNNTSCSWEILFNGSACTNPGPIRFDKYEGGTNSNRHEGSSFF